jgi:hypothetical protein
MDTNHKSSKTLHFVALSGTEHGNDDEPLQEGHF